MDFQHCMQEVQSMKQERIAKDIEDAMRAQNTVLSSELLMRIIKVLDLTSSQELLKEIIAVEKERMNAESSKLRGELNQMRLIMGLL